MSRSNALDSSPTDLGDFVSSPVFSTVSTDSDGFATVVIKDSSEPAVRFDADVLDREEEEFDSEAEDSENYPDEQQQEEDDEEEQEDTLENDDEEDEFPSLDEFPTTSVSQSTISRRPQLGGAFEDDDDSSSEEDEDGEDEAQVTVETAQTISSGTGDFIDRIMQHHSMKFALEKAQPTSAASTTSAATSSMTAQERELILLRSMLQSDASGALARMRQRASQELTETAKETRQMKQQQIEMDDLLGLIPQASEDERKQPSSNVIRTSSTNIHPSISPPARIASQSQPIQRVIRMADEDEMDEAFREEAAMMAAEMSDSDNDQANEDDIGQNEFEFSNLGSIDAAADDEQEASSVSARANRYSSQSPASNHPPRTSTSKASTQQIAIPSTVASQISIAPVASSSNRRGPPPGVPSAQMARQGVFLPENDRSTASSTSNALSIPTSAAVRAYPPSSSVDLPANLFTSSSALSFLKFTPESAKKLQAQFAREQSEFRQRIEHTSAPDASIHVIAPAGRDELDPSMFRS